MANLTVSVVGAVPQLVELILQVGDDSGATVPLRGVWVYLIDAGVTTVLRTEGDGRVWGLMRNGERTNPNHYARFFTIAVGKQIQLYYTRGAKPLSDNQLRTRQNVFAMHTIPAASGPQASQRPTSFITLPNILLRLVRPTELSIWPLLVEPPSSDYEKDGLAQGQNIWRNPDTDAPTVFAENGPSPAPRANVRPRERGLKVEGQIDARSTGAIIQILDSAGNPILLRTGFDPASPTSRQINPAFGPTHGNVKDYIATIFFADSANAFGSIQILIESSGLNPPIVDAFYVHLTGLQIALVDDHEANSNGSQRGPLKDENDDVNVVDFILSPRRRSAPAPNGLTPLSQQGRARRMIVYEITNEVRSLYPPDPPVINGVGLGRLQRGGNPVNPDVVRPQMPMWMAEFQLIGMTDAHLHELMLHRYFRKNGGLIDPDHPITLTFSMLWNLEFSFDGPDVDTDGSEDGPGGFLGFVAGAPDHVARPHQKHRYNPNPLPIPSGGTRQVAELHFGPAGEFVDKDGNQTNLGPNNDVPNTIQNPQPLTFPVATRRNPAVLVSGQPRPWGRQVGANDRPTVVIEFQPRIVDPDDNEIIRGGDGNLFLTEIDFDGTIIHPGMVEDNAGGLVEAPTHKVHNGVRTSLPLVALPTFRIVGTNPTHAQVLRLTEILVEEFLSSPNADQVRSGEGNAVSTLANVAGLNLNLLTLQQWQITAKLILYHESRNRLIQFKEGPVARNRWGPQYIFGDERGMPFFGPPHGYGIVQKDDPHTRQEEIWNFVECIRGGIRHLIVDKGAQAIRDFRDGTAAARAAFDALPQDTRRAIYRRQAVKRYNGSREFTFEPPQGAAVGTPARWAVHRSGGSEEYPNSVLINDPNHAPVALRNLLLGGVAQGVSPVQYDGAGRARPNHGDPFIQDFFGPGIP